MFKSTKDFEQSTFNFYHLKLYYRNEQIYVHINLSILLDLIHSWAFAENIPGARGRQICTNYFYSQRSFKTFISKMRKIYMLRFSRVAMEKT